MKTAVRYFIICFLLVLTSCSKSEDSNASDTMYYQKFSKNGVQINDDSFTENNYNGNYLLQRNGDRLELHFTFGENNILYYLSISFDEYGNLGQASISYQPAWPLSYTWYKNFLYDSAEHFHFQLDEYDAVGNTAKGNYSGKIYIDPEDENSDFFTIEGSFFLKIGNDEGVAGITRLKLKMNGADWRPTVFLSPLDVTYEGAFGYAANQFLSDDKYKIVIGHEDTTASAIGLHIFDNSNTDFFVKLGKYNAITKQFDYYVSSQGVLNIITAGHLPPSGIGYFYTGTFNLTATNPEAPFDIITITDGFINYHD